MINKEFAVLYIDDNIHNLNSFKATFRKEFKVYTASSAREGLALLEVITVQVIIADYKMPEMNGIDFFAAVVKKFPEPVRILLTGHADIKAVINAINKGEVYRFISKPWDEEELRVAIFNAKEIYYTRNLLAKRNEELQKSYEELDKFVYSAAHDLTAPLSSIQGLINIARMEGEDPYQYINLIEKSVLKLQVFVKNIIDYHRNNKKENEVEAIQFSELLNELKEDFNYFPNASATKVHFFINQNVPFYNDKTRIEIILNNLYSNAFKYQKINNEASFVKIFVDVDKEMAVIKVEDNGIGISDTQIDNIFKMFYRATQQNSGSGIGLYIVNEVVKKLNGDISVSSTKGEGSTFTIKIPQKNEFVKRPVDNVG